MKIARFEFNPFGENTYVIWDETTADAAIVDPGMINDAEQRVLYDFIENGGLTPRYILMTHFHIDHTFGIQRLKAKYNIPVVGHKADMPLAQTIAQQAARFHMPQPVDNIDIDRLVRADEPLTLGSDTITVIETPGHTPGGVCYYVPSAGFVLTGDTLFQHSIGRTDLPGGNGRQLISSIVAKLLTLPPATVVYPGHGPSTTIAAEAASNPFLQ